MTDLPIRGSREAAEQMSDAHREVRRLTLSAGEVAYTLGLASDYFRSIRRKLEAKGFPAKLPGMGKWSRPAVEAWIARNGKPDEAAPTTIVTVSEQVITDARNALEAANA